MRNFIIAGVIAATMAPALAGAQTPELRRDREDIRQERRDVRGAQNYGARRDERRDVRDARQEYREDWRDYRRSHADVYRGGRYVAPNRGWRYRPVTIGTRWEPAFYGQRYWIVDPYRYRLPRPLGFQRWVRYGNDVVLVDTRSGLVAQVYTGFFF